ncbi:hypothetical protein ZEAMMB73_Zm00001d044036 [Zea mays]|uniref:Uncharacterized protein n=1 Tax=Zea mays TaxID=4577 RepID=A0A1D6NHF6_MAIZE|nr:hypothetical protein ZEAMMB73_Zm00001d044036 [Zea mays]
MYVCLNPRSLLAMCYLSCFNWCVYNIFVSDSLLAMCYLSCFNWCVYNIFVSDYIWVFFFFIHFDADLCVGWMQHSKVWPFIRCCNH